MGSNPCKHRTVEQISSYSNYIRRRANSLSLNQTKQLNIIKPIALRPNQARSKANPNQTSSISSRANFSKFKSIDTIDLTTVSYFSLIQRRNTMPRLNPPSHISVRANLGINNSQHQQRPHLNFIKMKLQQLKLNSENFSQESVLISKLNSLDLNVNFDNNNNDNAYNTNYISDYSDYACLNRKQIFSSNSSIFSSVSSSSFLSYRNELNESDLDLVQIENDLNY